MTRTIWTAKNPPGPGDYLPTDPAPYAECETCGIETDQVLYVDHDGEREYPVYVCLECQGPKPCRHCGDPIEHNERGEWVDVNGLMSCSPFAKRHEPC